MKDAQRRGRRASATGERAAGVSNAYRVVLVSVAGPGRAEIRILAAKTRRDERQGWKISDAEDPEELVCVATVLQMSI